MSQHASSPPTPSFLDPSHPSSYPSSRPSSRHSSHPRSSSKSGRESDQEGLTVMVVGKGAAEHALSWKLSKSPLVGRIFVVPGNAGTARGMTKVSNMGPDMNWSGTSTSVLDTATVMPPGPRGDRNNEDSFTSSNGSAPAKDESTVDQEPVDVATNPATADTPGLPRTGAGVEMRERDTDYKRLVTVAQDHDVSLVILSAPDSAALVDGVSAIFEGTGIQVFAPRKEARVLGESKKAAKEFMVRHHIPTPNWKAFDELSTASEYIREVFDGTARTTHVNGKRPEAVAEGDSLEKEIGENTGRRVAIKASGYTVGSGVRGIVFPEMKEEALSEVAEILVHNKFGCDKDNKAIIVEDLVPSKASVEELTMMAFSDGKTWVTLPPVQVHKKAFDGELGPNTGGMGAYTPVPHVSAEDVKRIEEEVVRPTFEGLQAEGRNFVGLLFISILLTPEGPQVLGYNVRLQDPETQAMMMHLSPETDLAEIMLACMDGKLEEVRGRIKFNSGYSVTVIVAAGGYPGQFRHRQPIAFLGKSVTGVETFHGCTRIEDNALFTIGGRVFSISSCKETLKEAIDAAYQTVMTVGFADMRFRRDIGRRGLQKMAEAAGKEKASCPPSPQK